MAITMYHTAACSLTVALLLLAPDSGGGERVPGLTLTTDAAALDFGVVLTNGWTEQIVHVTNRCNETISLLESRSNCTCLRGTFASSTLRPTETTEWRIALNVCDGSVGEVRRDVWLHSDHARARRIKLPVRYRVVPDVYTEPEGVALGLLGDNVAEAETRIRSVSEQPLALLDVTCVDPSVDVELTEHSKSKPRLFDELSSSHEIVHQGDTNAIAAGVVVLNIADSFASPLRQTSSDGPLDITKHRQPDVTEAMVKHLGGLVMRESVGEVGFDAFAIIVVDCDNLGPCRLHTESPAPQPGDIHHYDTFISRITSAYEARFGQ